MDNDIKKDKNESDVSKKDSTKPDIPLWLQGLNDPENESSTEQDASDELETNYWIDEIDHNEPFEEQVPSEKKADNELSDDALPGWISELSRVEDSEKISSEELTTLEIKEENIPLEQPAEIEEMPGDNAELKDTSFDDSPPQEGFIEISGIGLPNSENIEPSISDLQPNDHEELPDWLQEMVNDPADKALGDTSPVVIPEDYNSKQESAQPEQSEIVSHDETPQLENEVYQAEIDEINNISPDANVDEFDQMQEISVSDESFQTNESMMTYGEELIDEEITRSEYSQGKINTAEFSIDEEIEILDDEKSQAIVDASIMETSKEDTVPIDLSKTTHKLNNLRIEPQRFIPKILLNAKDKLSTDEVDQGLETINIFIDEKAYLEDIKPWLEELSIEQNCNDYKIWETLGDLNFIQGEHQAAMSAYARATHLLMKMERDNDGSN